MDDGVPGVGSVFGLSRSGGPYDCWVKLSSGVSVGTKSKSSTDSVSGSSSAGGG